jgi:ATP-dependent Clp protease ATP-binding subunit ClpA
MQPLLCPTNSSLLLNDAQAIDLMDEAGSRARITAYTARQRSVQRESPKLRDYMQVQ